MIRPLTIVVVFGLGCLVGWAVPLSRLFDAFQPLIVALSIMIAALFVRLNRGMPTLEWSSLDPAKRTELTTRIVELSREYGLIVAINAITLSCLLTLIVVSKDDIRVNWPMWAQQITAGVIAALVALGVMRMAYVVWRDYDIVILQKYLIDQSAARNLAEAENKKAAEKISEIRSSGLRKIPLGDPRALGE